MGNIGAPAAAQRLWFWCKPLGCRQDRLEMRLKQLQDRMPPLRVPILTKMLVPASVASVLILMRCCSGRHRSSSVLLLCTIRMCIACTTCGEELMT